VTGKNGKILLDRPKPTTGCSANGRRKEEVTISHMLADGLSAVTISHPHEPRSSWTAVCPFIHTL
jgi:hypothetical protein